MFGKAERDARSVTLDGGMGGSLRGTSRPRVTGGRGGVPPPNRAGVHRRGDRQRNGRERFLASPATASGIRRPRTDNGGGSSSHWAERQGSPLLLQVRRPVSVPEDPVLEQRTGGPQCTGAWGRQRARRSDLAPPCAPRTSRPRVCLCVSRPSGREPRRDRSVETRPAGRSRESGSALVPGTPG